jgi:hypothetical protein
LVAIFIKDGECKFSIINNRKVVSVDENAFICFNYKDNPRFEIYTEANQKVVRYFLSR